MNTKAGPTALQASLNEGVLLNQTSSTARRAMAVSDANITVNGQNLAGGVSPSQPVGGYGNVLGQIYVTGMNGSALPSVQALLSQGGNLAGSNASVAKYYFAAGVIQSLRNPPPVVAPAGYTLPTFQGLPNTTNSVYDTAYQVTNTAAGQDTYGDSRPFQVAPGRYNLTFQQGTLGGLSSSPAFPSGHTTYAFSESILLAMLTPQVYQNMMVRAAEYGDSRIILGAHYPVDVIGGRALATFSIAQLLANPNYINNATVTGSNLDLPTQFNAASAQLSAYLSAQCGASVATCAASAANTASNPYVPSAENAAYYVSRLSYTLPTLSRSEAPPESAPKGHADASILLAPVYGGSSAAAKAIASTGGIYGNLSTDTINEIILNTEGPAIAAFYGTPLSYWTRLDLYAAAGYFDGVTGSLTLRPSDLLTRGANVAAGGTLVANGRITGPVTVLSGGRLGGTGTIGALTVQNGGTVAAGNSIGTLNVTGNVVLQGNSTNEVEVSAASVDRIAAGGSVQVQNANLKITAQTGVRQGVPYTFLTGQQGVQGSFSTISSNLRYLAPTVSFAGTAATLTFQRNSRPFARDANTSNQAAAAAAADALPATNPLYAALVSLLEGSSPTIFDALSGEVYASTSTVLQDQSILLRDAVGARLAQARGVGAVGGPVAAQLAPGWSPTLWVQGVGTFANYNASGPASGFDTDLGGLFFGADVPMGDWRVGVVGGYTQTQFQVGALNSSANIDSYDAGLYAGGRVAGFDMTLGASYSWQNGSVTRTVVVPGFLGTNMGSPDAATTQLFGEAAYDVRFAPLVVTPYAGLAYVHLNMDGMSEAGSASALTFSGSSMDTLYSTLGVRLRTDVLPVWGLNVAPTLGLAWLHAFGDTDATRTAAFATGSPTFEVNGIPLATDSALVQAGLGVALNPQSQLSITYSGQFADSAVINGFNASLSLRF